MNNPIELTEIYGLPFLTKVGVFIRWSSYVTTILLIAFIIRISYHGLPAMLKTYDARDMQDQIDDLRQGMMEAQQSLTSLVAFQQEMSAKDARVRVARK